MKFSKIIVAYAIGTTTSIALIGLAICVLLEIDPSPIVTTYITVMVGELAISAFIKVAEIITEKKKVEKE